MPDMLTEIQTSLDSPRLREQLARLFCETLNWGRSPGAPRSLALGAPINQTLTVEPVARLGGLPVLRVDWQGGELPNLSQRRAVYKAVAPTHLEHLLCYVTPDGRQASFVWARQRDKQVELRTLSYEQGTPARTTLERLSALAFAHQELVAGEPSVPVVTDRLNAAFDVEAVTKQFFKDYHNVFQNVEASVRGVPPGEPCRLYTQRLFNRLMFLYFIQRKGWLSFQGNKRYLRALFNAAEAAGEDFLNDRLYWTFFYGLNTAGEDFVLHSDARLRERRGEVPFLNGGLFDLEDEYDVRDRVKIPNLSFAEVFDLFDRYNFTVTESTPLDIEVAVDPEMLGKVFEELVTGRHESGSYYTPRPIVAFMCRESLKHYLAQVVGDEAAIARFVDEGDPAKLADPEAVLNALRAVKVCDPACGSGAYLLGMMQELLHLREVLFISHRLDAQKVYDRKLEIIQNNLYGVDIDLFAVNIAKLRLWLSLAIDYQGAKPPPLPNLDFKIECGDSLTAPDPQKIDDLFREILIQSADQLADLKGQFLQIYGATKKKLAERIKIEEQKLRGSLHENSPQGSVDWRVAFAEVFRSGGFDIVVANPPYVRQELITELKPVLKHNFDYIYQGAADLYIYFYARGVEILRDGGSLAFIAPNKFFRAGYGKKLRGHLTRNMRLHVILDFADFPIFEAITYPAIVVLQKMKPKLGNSVSLVKSYNWRPSDDLLSVHQVFQEKAASLPQSHFASEGWTISDHQSTRTLDKLRSVGQPLSQFIHGKLYYGIKTGCNEAFEINESVKEELCNKDPKSDDIIRPWLRGRNIERWNVDWEGMYLIFTRRGIEINRYPAIKKHLEPIRITPSGRKL